IALAGIEHRRALGVVRDPPVARNGLGGAVGVADDQAAGTWAAHDDELADRRWRTREQDVVPRTADRPDGGEAVTGDLRYLAAEVRRGRDVPVRWRQGVGSAGQPGEHGAGDGEQDKGQDGADAA